MNLICPIYIVGRPNPTGLIQIDSSRYVKMQIDHVELSYE